MDDMPVLGCDSALLCIWFPDVLRRCRGLISRALAYTSSSSSKLGRKVNRLIRTIIMQSVTCPLTLKLDSHYRHARGSLTDRPLYANYTPTDFSLHSNSTLRDRSRFAHYTLTVPSRFAHRSPTNCTLSDFSLYANCTSKDC